jgi:hypothetical protein
MSSAMDTKASRFYYLALSAKTLRDNYIRVGSVFLKTSSDDVGKTKIVNTIQEFGNPRILEDNQDCLDVWISHVKDKIPDHEKAVDEQVVSFKSWGAENPDILRGLSRIEDEYAAASKRRLMKEKEEAARRKELLVAEINKLMNDYEMAILDGNEGERIRLRKVISSYI